MCLVLAARRKRPSLANVEAAEKADAKPPRSKATFDLPDNLLDELRVASVICPPDVTGGGLSGLAERGLRELLQWLRDEYNDGKPFPAHKGVRLRRRSR